MDQEHVEEILVFWMQGIFYPSFLWFFMVTQKLTPHSKLFFKMSLIHINQPVLDVRVKSLKIVHFGCTVWPEKNVDSPFSISDSI